MDRKDNNGDVMNNDIDLRKKKAMEEMRLEDQELNESLQSVIADYWKGREKPGFTGYKEGQKVETPEDIPEEEPPAPKPVEKPAAKSATTPKPATVRKPPEKPAANSVPAQKPAEKAAVNPAATPKPEQKAAAKPATVRKPMEKSATNSVPAQKPAEKPAANPAATPKPEEKAAAKPATVQKPAEKPAKKPTTGKKPATTQTTVARTARNNKKKKKGGPLKVIFWVLLILALLALIGVGTLTLMRYMGKVRSNASNDSGEEIMSIDGAISEDGGKTIIYKGVTYTYNEDLSTILFIGVDKEEYEDEAAAGEAGQADTVFLTTINQKTGETRMIPISRNTMVAVDEYNADGSYWRQENVQLAVSYAYGTSQDASCKNVAKSVSRILYGMPVHKYVTMDMNAIIELNDAVGGVTVNCLEDLTDVHEEWTEGAEITLHGVDARTYVRHRKTTVSKKDQDNNAPRMERQKQYLENFIQTLLKKMKGNIFIPLTLYREVGDDIYTDVTASEIVYYTSMIVNKGFNNSILSIEGKSKHEEFTEFYPNQEKLYQLILDTFYERQ